MTMNVCSRSLVGAALIAVSFITPARGALVAQHMGGNDPLTEGWSFNDYTGLGGTFASGTDSEAHWRVAPNAGSTGRYLFPLTLAQVTDPAGWTLTVRAKLNASDRVVQAYFGVDDGPSPVTGTLWSLNMVKTVTDTGVYELVNPDTQGPQVSSIDPSLAYHTYNIYFDPAGDSGNGAVTYYMDGAVIGTQSRAGAQVQSVRRVEWGDSWNVGGASDAQYSLVRFETGFTVAVPEPSAMLLSGIGIMITVLPQLRRRLC